MRHTFVLILYGLSLLLTQRAEASPATSDELPHFVFVIPSYNNEQWAIQNISSCTSQSYENWHLFYVDDCSTDQTGSIISDYIDVHELHDKCTLIKNPERRGALANLYNVISQCQPTDIIVLVDGDDHLAHNNVLNVLAGYYLDPDTWMTYGNFTSMPPGWPSNCYPIPSDVCENNAFRSAFWVCGHVRTFYAGLFQRIEKEDLLWNGDFFPTTYDMACIFPMLEMSSRGHIQRIEDFLYVYNIANPLNDFKVNGQLQRDLDSYIRAMPRYQPLDTLFPVPESNN